MGVFLVSFVRLHENKARCSLAGTLGKWLPQDGSFPSLGFLVQSECSVQLVKQQAELERTAFTLGVLLASPSSQLLDVFCSLMKEVEMTPFSP